MRVADGGNGKICRDKRAIQDRKLSQNRNILPGANVTLTM